VRAAFRPRYSMHKGIFSYVLLVLFPWKPGANRYHTLSERGFFVFSSLIFVFSTSNFRLDPPAPGYEVGSRLPGRFTGSRLPRSPCKSFQPLKPYLKSHVTSYPLTSWRVRGEQLSQILRRIGTRRCRSVDHHCLEKRRVLFL
jgi:hypothetical protein